MKVKKEKKYNYKKLSLKKLKKLFDKNRNNIDVFCDKFWSSFSQQKNI